MWSGASTDDTSLGWAARHAGIRIIFVPQCVVPSAEDYSLSRLMAFGSRQLLLLRVYFPEMWWPLLALTAISALAPVAGLVLTVVALMIRSAMLIMGLALMTAGLASVFSTAIIARSTERLLAKLGEPVAALAWWHFLLSVPDAILLFVQFVRSGLTRRVKWRGITYDFLAPDRTVVVTQRRGNE